MSDERMRGGSAARAGDDRLSGTVTPEDPDQRFCHPMPAAEMKRRWAAARQEMADQGIDALIVQGANNTTGGGYYRWFTGLSAGVGNPNTVIFPSAGLMTLVCHGDDGGVRTLGGDEPEFCGIGRRLTVPNFPMASYLSHLDAEAISREIEAGGFQRIGLVGSGLMNHGFASQLIKLLPNHAWTDATDLIDELKAVKSPAEIAFVRHAAAMQDEILAKLADHIRPGMKDFELGAYAQYVGQLLGSESGHFHVASSPAATPAVFKQRQQQGRVIRNGDIVLFQCENSGPGGYFVHVGRAFVLGKTPREVSAMFAAALSAQDYTLELLNGRRSGREIFEVYNAYMSDKGLPVERRLHCHAQGYDTVERPLARPEEDMAFGPGMNVGIHPGIMQAGRFATVCDNFMIAADGAPERLHRTPRQIFEI